MRVQHSHPLLANELASELRVGMEYACVSPEQAQLVGGQLMRRYIPYLDSPAERAACIFGIAEGAMIVGGCSDFWQAQARKLAKEVLSDPTNFGLGELTSDQDEDLLSTFGFDRKSF